VGGGGAITTGIEDAEERRDPRRRSEAERAEEKLVRLWARGEGESQIVVVLPWGRGGGGIRG